MTIFKSSRSSMISQKGNALFMVLLAVALFAALSYVISQQRESGAALSAEKIRLLSTDVIDMGNKYADAVSQLRLRRVPNTKISFENTIVTDYINPSCTDDTCKVFAYAGGGKDWETPVPELNNGFDWAFTGDLSIPEMGSTDADLVAIIPNLSLQICNRINVMLNLYDATGSPPTFVGVTANKFIGTYAVVPADLTNPVIRAQKSACVEFDTQSGSAFPAALGSNPTYTYYHVLEAR